VVEKPQPIIKLPPLRRRATHLIENPRKTRSKNLPRKMRRMERNRANQRMLIPLKKSPGFPARQWSAQ
jgi:hypothetical protein